MIVKILLLSKHTRLFSTTNRTYNEVRVRFAPSPTGSIHLGGLRTALYNYLFAKKYNGEFILRIEDTDRTRTVSGSVDDIQQSLDWAGLYRDEGPREGGLYGPYLQSERVDLYKNKANELLETGKAYRCFCSPTRLELLRKQQARNREPPHYDRKCLNLTKSEIDEKMKENDGKFVVRFALDSGKIHFRDMIFGDIQNNFDSNVDSDPVILKSDGFPTYHFANVVDDHYMRISHVLRGSEWLSSTTKHIMIYKAFKWESPQFVHFPLITMKDGTKMSKRNNRSWVKSFIDEGYRPLAIVNFLTNMGGGLPKLKQDSHDIWTLGELAEIYDFSKVSCHPASIDLDRLKIFNANDLRLSWDRNPAKILEEFKSLMQKATMDTDMTDERVIETINMFISRVGTLKDLLSIDYAFLWRPPNLTWDKQGYLERGWNLEAIVSDIIESLANTEESLESRLRNVANKHNIEWAPLFRLVRRLLTNNDRGLPVHQLIRYLGEERSIQYLNHGLNYVTSL